MGDATSRDRLDRVAPPQVGVGSDFSAVLSGSGQGRGLFQMRERLGNVLLASLRMNAPAAIGSTAAGLVAVSLVIAFTGGSPNPLVHLYYLPIIFAASRFQWRGGLVAGLVAGAAAGPLSPLGVVADVDSLAPTWLVRLAIFVAIGILVAWLAGESSRGVSAFVRDARGARDLRRGLDRREFVAFYQPIIDLDSGRTAGFETLCRWRHPVHGITSPADFIPLAERTGAIIPLGTWILQDATRQAAEWVAEGAVDLVIAVNVSASQLCQADFARVVTAALDASRLNPQRLCLEITETAILHDRDTALANLEALHESGVLIALDDFGTGESSLAYLHDFPIDIVKIDLSFVGRVDRDARGAALVSAIIEMAKALGASTIGEGIERQSQLDALRVLGCGQGQGFFLGRPAPAAPPARIEKGT